MHCYAVGSKEAISHLEFHCKIAIVAMKIELDFLRKRILGFIAPEAWTSSSHSVAVGCYLLFKVGWLCLRLLIINTRDLCLKAGVPSMGGSF